MATIVFVPGAWSPKTLYNPFLQALSDTGHTVHYAAYPSFDPVDPAVTDCKADADALAQTLRTLVEDEGRDVLLVMHSYAGMPGSAAAKGLDKPSRKKQGKQGGVLGMVFMSAFLVPEGVSCAGMQGGQLASWILLDKPSTNLSIPEDSKGRFAADIDSPLFKNIEEMVRPHSYVAFHTPQPSPAWADSEYQGRIAFIVAAQDQAITKEVQYGMIAGTQQQWIIKEMDCGHFAPFITRAEDTVRLLEECLAEMPGAD